MKIATGRPMARKTMRVATTLTGVTACAAAFAPAAAAQPAAPTGKSAQSATKTTGTRVRLDSAAVSANHEPYHLWVYASYDIATLQACGYKTGGHLECTPIEGSGYTIAVSGREEFNMGGDWNRGRINLWWNGHGPGSWDTCNTNVGGFYGRNTGSTVVLTGKSYRPIGYGVTKC